MSKKVGVNCTREIPVGIRNGFGDMCGIVLATIVCRNKAQFVDGYFRRWREPFANRLDVTHGLQESIGLIEAGVLIRFRILAVLGIRIEVVGDELQWHSQLVVFGVEKIF